MLPFRTIVQIVIINLIAKVCQSVCPTSEPYYLAVDSTCYAQCPWNPPTQYYADAVTETCVQKCPDGRFGFDGNQTCISSCPTDPTMTYEDSVNNRCVNICPSNYFSYTADDTHADYQKCLENCPVGTFAESTDRECVETCPANTFHLQHATKPICTERCPNNYYGNPFDSTCEVAGSCPTSPVEYYASDADNMCVLECENNTFADTQTGRCLVFCSSGYFANPLTRVCVQDCPSDYYRSNVTRKCMLQCSEGEFIDKSTGNCTQTCTAGTYADNATKACESKCTYPTFSDDTVGRCVSTCSIGLYSDNQTQKCVDELDCHDNTVGDPSTRKCVEPSKCPSSPYYYANLVAKICTLKCASPLWGDKSTKTCVSECPWNPGTYVSWENSHTQECVTQCPENPILYADNSTKSCVPGCPSVSSTVPYRTYADDLSQSCVRVCPNGFKAHDDDNTCVSECSNNPTVLFHFVENSSCIENCPEGYYAETSKQLCVQSCPSVPSLFALESNNTCVAECPTNTYADSSTRRCVEWCPETTLQFADDSSNQCVDTCPISSDYFGEVLLSGRRKCVATCSDGYFADPLTRLCVQECEISKGYYGQLATPVKSCLLECPSGKFADNVTKQCLGKCPDIPKKYFGNTVTKKCVLTCPEFSYGNPLTNVCGQPTDCPAGHFADDSTNLCVELCPLLQETYGESTSRRCIKNCPSGKFADNTTRLCSGTCNTTAKLYKDSSTNRCVKQCPSEPSLYNDPLTFECSERCTGGKYALDTLRKCVDSCPSTPALYANKDTFRCVSECPDGTFSFSNNTVRECVRYCPITSYIGDLFTDNTTNSCVPQCPENESLFNFKHPSDDTIRQCVHTCPIVASTYYFSDEVTQSCVTTCPLKNLTYGDTFTLKCEKNCTRDQFRDNGTVRCTYECSSPYYADNTTWNCVKECPNGTFAFNTNRTCLRECPTGFYADEETKFCRSLCDHDVALWSDNTTWDCVDQCPSEPDMYADQNTHKCQFVCSGSLFADSQQRKCVSASECSGAKIGDPTSIRCVNICPIEVPSFLNPSSNECVTECTTGLYADNSTMQCVTQCPSSPDFYAYNHSTQGPTCVLYCPATYYRYEPDRDCRQSCPGPDYFRDPTTMRCVTACPDHYFAESIGQICVSSCGSNNKFGLQNLCHDSCSGNYNQDPTTDTCVRQCPHGYFSENNKCVTECQDADRFADPITKKCQLQCSVGYYAKSGSPNTCVMSCEPEYKLEADRTCRASCPQTADPLTNLFMDNNSYSCVLEVNCLPGWYAENTTGYCQQTCESTMYSDNTTRTCVDKCPEGYFGYNRVCYETCPIANLYAENDTNLCVGVCPDGSFADNYNQICMDICTLKQYSHTYDDSGTTKRVCLEMCPEGYFSDDIDKKCVDLCPQTTYGQNDTNKCLKTCPNGDFADEELNLCVAQCNETRAEFADPSTGRCVTDCPTVPSLYADPNSRTCKAFCPTNWYALNTTRVCTQDCPSPYFADPTTGYCALKCHVGTDRFADNQTRSCVLNCPNYTDPITGEMVLTYEDNSTKSCVHQCPFYPSLYGHNDTNECVENCPSGTFGDNDTRICLDECFFNISVNSEMKYTFADPTTHFCVKTCPIGRFADNQTKECTTLCSLGTRGDNSTRKCVYMCPFNPLSYAKESTRMCVYHCDQGFYGDEVGRVCSSTCPTTPFFYYRDHQNRRCVLNCTIGYYADQSTQECATQCSVGYYKSLSQHACIKCPSSCLTCIAELNCTSCVVGLYLHEGECIASCPTFPVIYYASDQSSSCTQTCVSPYFGFDGTGKCEIDCPQTYFNDISDNTCKSCATGCRTCTTTDVCLSCLTGYIHVSEYSSCSQICNSTHIYYANGVCASSCVDGTFLLSDLVTCQKCSTQCSTCSVSGNNCTTCSNKFWYNFNCVSSCPDNFYADSNFTCRECKENSAACTVEPLRFSIHPFTKDYQLYAYVIFNREVNLTLAQFNRAVIVSTKQGPIKSSQYVSSVHNSTAFLVRFILTSASASDSSSVTSLSSLNENSLSIGFTPGTIVDQYGNTLVESIESAQVESLETVSVEIETQATGLKSDFSILSWILIVVLLLMMVRSSYPLLVLIDFLQLLYMHLFVALGTLPYLWMKTLTVFENAHFLFLPKLHTETDTSPSNPYYLFKEDVTALGNLQPFVFFAAIFGLVYGLFWLIGSKKLPCCGKFQKPARKIFKNRMKYSFVNEVFYYTQLIVLFFAFLQFSSNKSDREPGLNLSLSIVLSLLYIGWLLLLFYKSSQYKNHLATERVPKRFSFLTLEPSQFPLDIALRYLLKVLLVCALIIPSMSVQLILLMILNSVYGMYTWIYRPSISKITNYVNVGVSVGWVGYEIVLFVYGVSENKTEDVQQVFSYALLIIAGVMLCVILGWLLYRFALYVRQDCLGYEGPVSAVALWDDERIKHSQDGLSMYSVSEKTHSKHKQKYSALNRLNQKPSQSKNIPLSRNNNSMMESSQRGLNLLSELNLEEDQAMESDSDRSIGDEEINEQYDYYRNVKRPEGEQKLEQELMRKNAPGSLMGKNAVSPSKKKNRDQIVIEIDEHELIDHPDSLLMGNSNGPSQNRRLMLSQEQKRKSIDQIQKVSSGNRGEEVQEGSHYELEHVDLNDGRGDSLSPSQVEESSEPSSEFYRNYKTKKQLREEERQFQEEQQQRILSEGRKQPGNGNEQNLVIWDEVDSSQNDAERISEF